MSLTVVQLAQHRFDFAWFKALWCQYTWYIIFQQVQLSSQGSLSYTLLQVLPKAKKMAPHRQPAGNKHVHIAFSFAAYEVQYATYHYYVHLPMVCWHDRGGNKVALVGCWGSRHVIV